VGAIGPPPDLSLPTSVFSRSLYVITRARFLILPALLLLTIGCGGSGNRGVSLTGTVKYKGAPVTGGMMTLFFGNVAYPVGIGADGTFSVTQLPEGDAVATVDTESLNPNKPKYGGKMGGGMSPPPAGASTGPQGTYVKIPAKYRDKAKSDLKVTLKAGKQEKTFELTD